MDLLPSEEQNEIADTVRAQLEADFDLHALAERDFEPSVVDPVLWSRCAELGWFSLGLAEADGGIGYGTPEEALLFEEIGAHATPGPFLATVLAAHVAAAAGERDLVESITTGSLRVAGAEPEAAPDGPEPASGTVAVRVTDWHGADLVLLLRGRTAQLHSTDGLHFDEQLSFDPLVPLAVTELDPSPSGGTGTGSLRCAVEDPSIALRATVLAAAELAGIARATAEQSSTYAMDREQFGRPVGSFQAVKHRCVDMAVRAEAAVQLTRLASLAVQGHIGAGGGHPDAPFQAEAAWVTAARAAVENAEVNVQNHGGIGFTYEHTAHRYVTRARVRSFAGGGLRGHMAALLSADAPA